ncbi:MAG TPA: hypothetical protein VHP83_04195 [Aggregatilineaceae bacterium]|nr:hypothetical protein [Aggregatilineaceae bacterium]
MATNASTWFYVEPEHRPYFLEERVNHTFWSNRITAVSFDTISAESPFRMEGQWYDAPVSIEWVPNEYFILTAVPRDNTDQLIVGVKEILGFAPTISYTNEQGNVIAEWYTKAADARIQAVQNKPAYRNIKLYKK